MNIFLKRKLGKIFINVKDLYKTDLMKSRKWKKSTVEFNNISGKQKIHCYH